MDQATARAQLAEQDQERESAAYFSPVIGIGVTAMSFDDHVERIIGLATGPTEGGFVCVANVHMLVEARLRWEFREILDSALLVTPDGMPLVWMLRRNGWLNQERVAGMDLLPAICDRAADIGVPVFFLGATDEVLESIRARLAHEVPGLKVAGMHAPPFRPLTESEDDDLVDLINRSGARLLLVALGCPKQEQWMYEHRKRLRPIMVGLGAAFGVYAGMQRRAPVAMQRSGLEWLFRLAQEPKRLWKRYLATNTRFLAYVVEEAIQSLLARTRSAEE
jgi:N-acetylglucosaminyldiphosphoundecaprenol N-acetyl-beta-D-mannosaminyltransferase